MVDGVAEPTGTNSLSRFPSSPAVHNAGHSLTHIPYPSSALSSLAEPQSKLYSEKQEQRSYLPPPLTDHNVATSPISKTAASFSYSKNHSVLPIILKLNPRLVVQNTGCVARDHLSSERTFLGYVHTSLAFAIAGVSIVQLFNITTSTSSGIPLGEPNRVKTLAMPLGILSLIFALFVLFLEVDSKTPQGVYRYFVVQYALPKNMFPVAQSSIVFISFVFGAFVVVVLGALLDGKMGL